MIIFEGITLRRGPQVLFSNASITLQPGQNIALIGANGAGKSSLFALLMGELQADQGDIRGLDGLRLAHMAQESERSSLSATDYVVAGDTAVWSTLNAIAESEQRGDFESAAIQHQQLETLDGYSAPRRAQQLLLGLGFALEQLDHPVQQFSGGWRIRLNLARALMTPSDVLLLDEPTNHLDLDATLWLQAWLQNYDGTLFMISHDRDFIDATCQRVLKIEHQQLTAYRGGYSDYEQQRAEQLAQQQATFEKQQRRVAEIEDFVRRFRAKATKAKQAQSRLKELERMQRVAPAHVDSPFRFTFPEPGRTSDPLLTLDRAKIGYAEHTVLTDVALTLRPGDRIGLLGKNGAGKSTLLKSITGALPLLDGDRVSGAYLRLGYFDQQQLEVLDLDASPLLHLQRLSPTAREQQVLDFLGGFNFKGDQAVTSIRPFSGGEKARLALAMVVWQDPNLLILDEPTNHLDLDMRHALEVALQGYSGALLLVSHDRHLLRNVTEELLLVDSARVNEYPEDIATYERWILSNTVSSAPTLDGKPTATQSVTQSENPSAAPSARAPSRKNQRQEAAERRSRLRPLQQQVDKTERALESAQETLAALQAELADPNIYDDARRDDLAELVRREGETKQTIDTLEQQWLAASEALEVASGSQ